MVVMSSTEEVKVKPPAEIKVGDFSSLIASMSRLLSGLGRIKPFAEAELGLAEWVALTLLAERDGVSNKLLGRNLGVSGQRANQIGSSLAKAGLIVVNQSAEDSRANEIKITAAGKAKVESLNSQLKTLLDDALKGRERSLVSAAKQLKLLSRVVRVEKPEKAGKKAKKAKNEKES
jgi:DNA-binding MarR family transcriptional regulator